MSTIPVSKASGEIPDVKPGVYQVTCVRVKDDVLENPQYGDGEVVRLYMSFDDLTDDDSEHIELDALANRKITPKSKLTRWAEALGRPIDFDHEDEFDTEELQGGQCLAKVIRQDAQSWPRIEDLTARPTVGKPQANGGKAPSLITATGEIDFDAFWREVTRYGGTRKGVAEMIGGDLNKITEVEPTQLVALVDKLRGI